MNMKKILAILCALVLIISTTSALADLKDYKVVTSSETTKVILDTDMGYFGDDTYALMILLQADAAGYIDLLGITATGANVTIAEGTCAILNQLEYFGRTDIPVYMGTDVPLCGFRSDDELTTYGMNRIKSMKKVMKYGDTIAWNDLKDLKNETWGYPKTIAPQDKPSWQFMIDAVNENPGKVVIMSIGACTNIATACMADRNFAAKTAGIYYMGGAIDVPGNDTPCAERNFYYDVESVNICLNSPFPKQVIVPNDISYYQRLDIDKVKAMANSGDTKYNQAIKEFAVPVFEKDPERKQRLWDAQVPGILICPELISKTDVRDVQIQTDLGITYGETVAWQNGTGNENYHGPATSTTCTIVYDVDGQRYWSWVAELLGTDFSK